MTQQPNTVENTNIFSIKIVFVELPKTIYKLSKTIWQAEKVSQEIGANKNSSSPLYSETKKMKMQKQWNDHMFKKAIQILILLKFWLFFKFEL